MEVDYKDMKSMSQELEKHVLEVLAEHLQWCTVRCPFCTVTCSNPTKEHIQDHRPFNHYLLCLNGFAGKTADGQLNLQTCTELSQMTRFSSRTFTWIIQWKKSSAIFSTTSLFPTKQMGFRSKITDIYSPTRESIPGLSYRRIYAGNFPGNVLDPVGRVTRMSRKLRCCQNTQGMDFNNKTLVQRFLSASSIFSCDVKNDRLSRHHRQNILQWSNFGHWMFIYFLLCFVVRWTLLF